MELLKHEQLNGVEAGWPPPDGVYWAITSLSSAEAGPVAMHGFGWAWQGAAGWMPALVESWMYLGYYYGMYFGSWWQNCSENLLGLILSIEFGYSMLRWCFDFDACFSNSC
ncbi:hypothetical protein Nepgr_017432 [Nepenthes gracilis]|uniref:Uncharacterized protein n=1 Tax=Nepenthes gracilis TaxID=150966 RepID=A0AAD3SSM2_NEPGR|nr:hypothetical protein Nepgr_017432 [Nepenthes gracilis]